VKNYQYILTHSSGNLTLEYNPINWDVFNIVYRRSGRYHSVLRSQVLDVEFPFDGKEYVDDIYDTYGIDTEIGCEIKYLNKLSMAYVTLYTGIIDLSVWASMRDTTTVKIIDSSVMAKFASRDEIQVPINRAADLDGDAVASYTYLDQFTIQGVDIEQKAEYSNINNEIVPNAISLVAISQTDNYGVDNSGFDINEIGADATLPAETIASIPSTDEDIYTNGTGSVIDVRFRIITAVSGRIDIEAAAGWTSDILVKTGKNGATTAININDSGSGDDNFSVSGIYDSGWITETLSTIPDTIEIYHQWTVTGTIGDDFTPDLDTPLKFTPIFIAVYEITDGFASTPIDLPPVHEVGAKLLEIITGVSDPLNAPILGRTDSEPRTYVADGDYSLMAVASGENLRRFDFDDKPLTTSFWDYFKSIDALRNLGCWYDGTEFIIAEKEDFYSVSEIIVLDEVADLEISVAKDKYFNKVICGYKDELSYEDVNGNQTFTVPMEYSNDGQRIDGKLDIQSVFHADDYGIELARASSSSSTYSDDVDQDEQIFFIWSERDGPYYISVPGSDLNAVTGLYAPDTRLNLHLTSKRNLLQHLNQLSIPLFKSSGDTNYMTKQFELALSTQIGGGDPVIAEKDDLAYADLEEPLYYPELYNFTAELTNDHITQLQSDPHGYVSFDYLGVTYSGYIVEVSTEPFNKRGNWTLLRRNPDR
jgi:hypothetical protein